MSANIVKLASVASIVFCFFSLYSLEKTKEIDWVYLCRVTQLWALFKGSHAG